MSKKLYNEENILLFMETTYQNVIILNVKVS